MTCCILCETVRNFVKSYCKTWAKGCKNYKLVQITSSFCGNLWWNLTFKNLTWFTIFYLRYSKMLNTYMPFVVFFSNKIHLFVCLSVCLFICLSVYLFICLSVYLFICLSISVFICLSVYLFICLSVYLFICLSGYLFICLSVYLFIWPYVVFFFSNKIHFSKN